MTVNRQASDSQVTTIEEGNKERKEEYNKSPKGDYESGTPENSIYATIRELYNSVCGSYPRLVKMSEARKKAINARMKTGYTLDDFQTLFEKAEASDFLKGKINATGQQHLTGWSVIPTWQRSLTETMMREKRR